MNGRLPCVLLVTLCVRVALAQEAEAVQKVYALGDLVAQPASNPVFRLGLDDGSSWLSMRIMGRGVGDHFSDRASDESLTIDHLQSCIQDAVVPGTWEGENTIRSHGQSLVVRHTAAAHEHVAALLAELRRARLAPIVLEVAVYEASSSAADAVLGGAPTLDPARLEALARPPWRRVSVTRAVRYPGESRLTRVGEDRRYLHDFRLEIAESAFILDPEDLRLHTGEALSLEVATSIQGDRLGVRCVFHWAEETLPRPTFASGIRVIRDGQASVAPYSVEQPRVRTRACGSHVLLPTGGAAIAGAFGSRDVRVVVVRHVAPPPVARPIDAVEGRPRVLDTGLLLMAHDDLQGPRFEPPDEAPRGSITMEASEDVETSEWDFDSLIERLKDDVDPSSWEEEPRELFQSGRALVALNRPDVYPKLVQRIAIAERELGQSALVRARLLVSRPDLALDLAQWAGRPLDRDGAAALAALVLDKPEAIAADLSVTGRANRWVSAFDGEAMPYVADFDVEIAQRIAADDPVMRTLQLGTSLSVRMSQGDREHISLELRLDRAELLEMTKLELREGVALQQPRVHRIDQNLRLVLSPRGAELVDLGGGGYLWVELRAGAEVAVPR